MRRYDLMLIVMLMKLTGCASAETEECEGLHRHKRIYWQEQVRLFTGVIINERSVDER